MPPPYQIVQTSYFHFSTEGLVCLSAYKASCNALRCHIGVSMYNKRNRTNNMQKTVSVVKPKPRIPIQKTNHNLPYEGLSL